MKPKASLRFFLALAGSSLLTANSASAQVDGNWNSNLTGNWSNTARWSSNPDIPGGAGSIVGINSDITVNNLAVTIDTTSRTVGSLTIGDSNNSHGFLLNATGGASLIFDNNGSGATLTETGSIADTISAPITLADNLGVSVAGNLSLTGEISQTGGVRSLTKTGAGGLYLANTSNSFSGGVFLNAGTLYTGSNAAAFGTGRLTINGGRIDIATSSGTSGTTVTTTNANTWNASWAIGRGSTGDGTWNNNGDILLGATVAVTSANNNTFLNLGGVISDGGNNYGVSFGSNRTTLSNANTFTGLTTLSAGTLRLSHANALSASSGVRLATGTLDLTTNTTIKALTLVGNNSTVTGGFNLDFSSGGTILHEDSTGNRAGSITSGITGSPTVTVTAGETLTLNPGSLTQTLGAVAVNPRQSGTQDNGVTLDGTSTGNSIGNITQTTTSNGQRTSLTKNGTGTWTVGNLAGVGGSRLRVLPNAGRLIVTGDIYGVELAMGAGGTLELQKSGNLFTTTGGASNSITQLRGTIDNTSGGLITFASNPTIALTGDFTHAGNSINMGTGTVTLNATTRQVTVSNAASTLTLGGIISGTNFGITKAGDGTINLTNANTYTGATTVNAGTLVVGAGSLANTAIAANNAGSTFAVTGSGTINLGTTGVGTAGATLTLGNGTSFSMMNGLIGTVNLRQQDTFATSGLILSGGASLNFEVGSATADKLAVTKGATVSGTNLINVAGVTSMGGGPYDLITAPSGLSGTYNFGGSGTTSQTVAVGTNAYLLTLDGTSGTAVTVTVGAPTAIASGVTWTGRTNGNGAANSNWDNAINNNWAANTTASAVSNGTAVTFGDTNAADSDVAITNSTVTVAAQGVTPTSTTFNNSAVNYTLGGGSIGGTGTLTKSGSGTVTLTGANTYTGGTTVSAGTLLVNNTTGSGTGTNTVTVGTNGTLGGSGTISGAVKVDGALKPGNSTGLLTVGSLDLNANASTTLEINGTDRGVITDGYDALDVNTGGSIDLGGALNFVFGNLAAFADNTEFDLFSFDTTSTGNFTSVASTGFYTGTWGKTGDIWSLTDEGQTLNFSEVTGNLTVIPEPAAALLGSLGILLLLRRRRA